ncbi:hypothetical protein CPJCM30710_25000 [Clostridium polyendosporum]|uniref:MurNAc-LAA domain-containing protein n=1 Tax=Clostridium polyendosporum TaxID=69208 RepID=A0A919VF33_9CLOT|nr:N-acetylmuramoyl-L-alanine amidase [Clostridium polyendosporum]GIM29834.1 hypothetical protein CPJCM30710_25000 [Clostridium polyendosporum]
MAKWMGDPGHGGYDPGAVGPTGLEESQVVLKVMKRWKEIMEAAGEEVRLTRKDDAFIGLSERARLANEWGATYFVSKHENSCYTESVVGTEVFAFSSGGHGEKLANCVLDDLIWAGQVSNSRGVKFVNFAVLRETNMPAILIEGDFISNRGAESKMRTDEWIEAEARAIARGCLRYIGKDLPQPKTTPAPQPAKPSKPIENNTYFRVVVGSCKERGNAEEVQRKLKQAGFDSFLVAFEK